MTLVSFEAAHDIGDRFLSLLSGYDIQPPSGSSLEDELLSLTQLIEVMKNPHLAQGPNETSMLRAAAGLHDLAAKVLSVQNIAEFDTFVPHLKLIAKGNVRKASLVQNAASEYDDDTSRKMAELYMGCLAAHIGTEVVLDSPTNAKGDNPDVIFKVQQQHRIESSERWALAIKTISSRQGQTIFERIKEGAKQIDDQKCPADRGMVVINAKSALDHDRLWEATFPDLQKAVEAISEQLEHLANSSAADRPQTEWDDLFSKGKVARPVLFLGQSLVRLPTPAGMQTPTPLKILQVFAARGTPDPVAVQLAAAMNDSMQRIVHGEPGSYLTQPS